MLALRVRQGEAVMKDYGAYVSDKLDCLASVATVRSIVTCYGKLLAVSALALLGVSSRRAQALPEGDVQLILLSAEQGDRNEQINRRIIGGRVRTPYSERRTTANTLPKLAQSLSSTAVTFPER